MARHIRKIARGKHGSEHLSQTQARESLLALLKGNDELQLGAFLIGQRMKGETAAELAGFTQAARMQMPDYDTLPVRDNTVDLPCYAGKRRAPALHLSAAMRIRAEGVRVLVHGVSDIPGRMSAWQLLQEAGVQRASSLAEAGDLLDREAMAYLDLEDACPPLFRLYHLRERLGLRSFANSVARLLNPLQCSGQLNGIFHTPYAYSMAQANVLLGQHRSLIFNGAEGEPELYADRQKVVVMQCGQSTDVLHMPDMGFEAYPRKVCIELQDLQRQQRRVMAGDCSPREKAALARMQEAFHWAARDASGDISATWERKESLRKKQEVL